jgi:hypothetical protein
MSTLRCTNLQDTSGGNSLTTAQIYNGAAKAWVNFNGTGTPSIRASFNVSSITDNGVGTYTVNFSNALADANYSAVCSGSRASNFLGYGGLKARPSSTSACPVYFYIEDQYYGESALDGDTLCVSVFR